MCRVCVGSSGVGNGTSAAAALELCRAKESGVGAFATPAAAARGEAPARRRSLTANMLLSRDTESAPPLCSVRSAAACGRGRGCRGGGAAWSSAGSVPAKRRALRGPACGPPTRRCRRGGRSGWRLVGRWGWGQGEAKGGEEEGAVGAVRGEQPHGGQVACPQQLAVNEASAARGRGSTLPRAPLKQAPCSGVCPTAVAASTAAPAARGHLRALLPRARESGG